MRTTALRRTGIVSAAGLTMLALATPASAHAEEDASLSVLHGVPGLTVDVWVDGERTLDDFEPAALAGPLELAPGTYSVAITAADAEDDSEPVLGPLDLPLEAGGNYTAVAHLDEAGEPKASFFTNDLSPVEAGQGRLTVRHVAAAPAVDVLAGDTPVIEGLANGGEKSLDLPAGTVSASVAAAGTTDPVIGPADVPVTEGAGTIVYAWGSLEDDTLAVATQTIESLHSAPGAVPSGLVEVPGDGAPVGALAGAGLLALLAALVTRRLVRARS